MSYRVFISAIALMTVFTASLFAAAVVPPTGTYTLVAMPDTQHYADSSTNAYIFTEQTQWIVNNKDAHQIKYAMHLGDITNNNNTTQWNKAKASLSVLDGKVPYSLAPGNHDYGTNGSCDDRTSQFNYNQNFGPTSPYATQSSIGGFFETGKTDNSYHTLQMDDQDWLILTMEFGPRDNVVAWANNVLKTHPNHKAIVTTHAYMYNQSVRYDYELFGSAQTWNPHTYGVSSLPGGVNDGQEIWDKMLKDNSNVFMVLNGHVLGDGTGYREMIREDGTVLHEMLVNYQMDPSGGNGYMRLFEFLPDESTVNVKSYSPHTGLYNTDPDQQFTIAVFDRPVNRDQRRAVLADSPVLYYRPQENLATEPVTNLGSAGTTNDGTYTGPGPLASDFDGSTTNQIEVGAVDEMSQWSITSWVRPSAVDTRQTIISNDRRGWNDDVLFGLGPDGYNNGTDMGHWALSHHDDETQTATIVQSPTAANADQWYHVSATCDGNVVRLYVDGNLVDETAKSGNDIDWAAISNRVGRSFNTTDSGRPFDGTIGEVAVFNTAISTSDVETQRLAAFNRVTAGNMVMTGVAIPSSNTFSGVTIPQQSLPGISTGNTNRGDFEVIIGDRPSYAREGVMLATVTQNGRDGIYGSVEVGLNSFNNGALSLATSRAGASSNVEVNINTSVAWFPFSAGWKGGHVRANGSFPAVGYDMDDTTVSKTSTGLYKVDLGVDSQNEGMFFTIGANNNHYVTTTQVDSLGTGWHVAVQNNGTTARVNADFSFVYIPYDSENLIGGDYNGNTGIHDKSFGDFTMSKLTSGRYDLSIDGETPETGMLILCVVNDTSLNDNLLSYQASGDSFIIESRAISGLSLDDTGFYWAFISFNDPLSVPEPSTIVLLLLGALTLFLRKVKR